MARLAVAESDNAIIPTFQHMYTHGRPGMQMGPDIPIEDALSILQDHMRREFGIEGFTFNVAFGTTAPSADVTSVVHFYHKPGNNDSGPHIDEPEARRELGVVVHDNLIGIGTVALQLAKLGVVDIDARSRRARTPVIGQVASRTYEGQLIPGMKTLFSEGLVARSGIIAVRMGPSIHDFRTTGDNRAWTRYGWEPTARN